MAFTTDFTLYSQTRRLSGSLQSAQATGDTGLAPSMAWSLTQENLRQPAARIRTTFTLQLQVPLPTLGFSAGLFPFHSQLLWESPLVSFPTLSNMLKFSG